MAVDVVARMLAVDSQKSVANVKAEQNKKFELIETITVEEEGIYAIERTVEPDGTPYDMEKVLIVAETEKSNFETAGTTFYFYAGRGSDSGEEQSLVICHYTSGIFSSTNKKRFTIC
jgi:hypothetical protein